MAFQEINLLKLSAGNSQPNQAASWTYKSTTDTLATIIASGYFNSLVQTAIQASVLFGDKIWIVGSDGNVGQYYFNSASFATPVTVAAIP